MSKYVSIVFEDDIGIQTSCAVHDLVIRGSDGSYYVNHIDLDKERYGHKALIEIGTTWMELSDVLEYALKGLNRDIFLGAKEYKGDQ